ncbi:MAG: SH3 domain-containing protein [Anaerolineaceae bacterium]|nr:SH3 domain-containing protein [Anaerolineaceae bacterium]
MVIALPLLAQSETCSGAPASRLVVGEQGNVTAGGANNLRAQPRTDAELIGQIPAGGIFIVLAGPTCADGYAWWQVDYNGLVGWTVEGQASDYWLEPLGPVPTQAPTVTLFPSSTPEFPLGTACPGFLPSRLIVGEQGRVTAGGTNNMRVDPDAGSEKVGEIRAGARFLVLEGPVCAGGLAWWRVEYSRVTGWTAEGLNDTYWLEPAGPVPTQAPTLTPTITNTPRPTSTPAPTSTSVPPLPELQTFSRLNALLYEPLPDDLEVITTENVHALRPLSILGYGRIRSMSLSPDGKMLVLITSVGVWVQSLEDIEAEGWFLDLPHFDARHSAFSADGQLLAIAAEPSPVTDHQTVVLVNLTNGQQEALPYRTNRTISALRFSPDGTWLAISSSRDLYDDKRVTFVNLVTEQHEVIEINEQMGVVSQIAFSRDSQLVAMSDGRHEVVIFNLALGEHQISYRVDDTIGAVGFSADGRFVLSAGSTSANASGGFGVFRVWDLATSERIATLRFDGGLREVLLTADGQTMIVASQAPNQFFLIDAETFTVKDEFTFSVPYIYLAMTPDDYLLVSHNDGSIREWNLERVMHFHRQKAMP